MEVSYVFKIDRILPASECRSWQDHVNRESYLMLGSEMERLKEQHCLTSEDGASIHFVYRHLDMKDALIVVTVCRQDSGIVSIDTASAS